MTDRPIHTPDQIPVGEKRCWIVRDRAVCVVHCTDGFFAVDDRCSHAQASLTDGMIREDREIEYPLHGSCFDIRTRRAMTLSAVQPL